MYLSGKGFISPPLLKDSFTRYKILVDFFFPQDLFIYFWLCWVFIAVHGLSLVVESGDYSLVVVCWFLSAVASLVAEHRLYGAGASVAVARGLSHCRSQALEHRLSSSAHGLSCSVACGILRNQVLNLCFLH